MYLLFKTLQCSKHRYLGWQIHVSDEGVTAQERADDAPHVKATVLAVWAAFATAVLMASM